MSTPDNRINDVVTAYLDYLEGLGEEPSLDHLTAEERRIAQERIESMKYGRGIDPYASSSSLQQLLAGTEFEDALVAGAQSSAQDLLTAIRRDLSGDGDQSVVVSDDAAAVARGLASDFVLFMGSQRLRIVVRRNGCTPASLATIDPTAVAGPIFGAFPDTAGIIAVCPNEELSSIAIDPYEPELCIEAPRGDVAQPSLHRPVLPLADTIRSYMNEVAPSLDMTSPIEVVSDVDAIDSVLIAHVAAELGVQSVVDDGRRARIEAKRASWTSFGDTEIRAIERFLVNAMNGGGSLDVEALISELSDVA